MPGHLKRRSGKYWESVATSLLDFDAAIHWRVVRRDTIPIGLRSAYNYVDEEVDATIIDIDATIIDFDATIIDFDATIIVSTQQLLTSTQRQITNDYRTALQVKLKHLDATFLIIGTLTHYNY